MKKVIIEQSGQESIILNVPEGASVRIDDGVAIVEPKFKMGDVLFDSLCPNIQIYSGSVDCIAQLFLDKNKLFFDGTTGTDLDFCRYATDTEKQLLFDALAKEGKRWDSEKLEVVDLKYTPKVGDCVKLIDTDWVHPIFFVCGHVNGLDIYEAGDIISHDRVIEKKSSFPFIRVPHISYEKITPEELQAEFNKLGYEYDFETHTAKVWKPKNDEAYCCVAAKGGKIHQIWLNDRLDNARLEMKNVFHPDDKEGIEKYIAHIKSFER